MKLRSLARRYGVTKLLLNLPDRDVRTQKRKERLKALLIVDYIKIVVNLKTGPSAWKKDKEPDRVLNVNVNIAKWPTVNVVNMCGYATNTISCARDGSLPRPSICACNATTIDPVVRTRMSISWTSAKDISCSHKGNLRIVPTIIICQVGIQYAPLSKIILLKLKKQMWTRA